MDRSNKKMSERGFKSLGLIHTAEDEHVEVSVRFG